MKEATSVGIGSKLSSHSTSTTSGGNECQSGESGDSINADTLKKLKIPEFKEQLRALKLPVSGRKQQLIDRIMAHKIVGSDLQEVMSLVSTSNAAQHHKEILRDLDCMDGDCKNDSNTKKNCSDTVDEQIEEDSSE